MSRAEIRPISGLNSTQSFDPELLRRLLSSETKLKLGKKAYSLFFSTMFFLTSIACYGSGIPVEDQKATRRAEAGGVQSDLVTTDQGWTIENINRALGGVIIVQRGDTIYSLLRAYGLGESQLEEATKIIVRENGIENPNKLYPGQRLIFPPLEELR